MAANPPKTISSWFDEATNAPIIAERAQQLESFVAAMADGVVEPSEVEAQEARLVKLMKEVEPLLTPELHAKITELLCELTAYDLMQMLAMMHQARPKSVFRG